MKNPQNKIKQKLKDYYRYLDSDFIEQDNIIYMNCQDSVMIKATDLWENLESERKEKYVIGFDPCEQNSEGSSYGAVYKVKPSGTLELIKYEK